jgi:NADPH2:quinone reductase
MSVNSGDDIAGTVYNLGEDVLASGEFHIGDRVAAFHPMLSPGGAYAEYAVAPQSTIMKLPKGVGFEGNWNAPLKISITNIIQKPRPFPW